MNLCLPYTPCVVHPLWIVTWKVGCPCVSLCLYPIHPGCGPTPWLECVHASVHEFMSTWQLMSGPRPMHSLMETWVHACMAVFLYPSHLISLATPCLECVHASVHEFMSTLHPMSGPPLWIVTWKVGCTCVSLCLCPIHPGCGPTPCLECVHASVHEFMSTWLLMSGPPPMHSLMETLVPLYGSVFVSQSSHICCHTLFRMCTCIRTWYLCPPYSSCLAQPPMDSYMESWVHLCVTACLCPSHPAFGADTLFRMCTSIRTWIYVHLAAYVWSTPYA